MRTGSYAVEARAERFRARYRRLIDEGDEELERLEAAAKAAERAEQMGRADDAKMHRRDERRHRRRCRVLEERINTTREKLRAHERKWKLIGDASVPVRSRPGEVTPMRLLLSPRPLAG